MNHLYFNSGQIRNKFIYIRIVSNRFPARVGRAPRPTFHYSPNTNEGCI